MSSARYPSQSHDMQSSLAELRNIVGLVVFAINAQRVMQSIDVVSDGSPRVRAAPGDFINDHRQLMECPDSAFEVLCGVYERLDELVSLATGADL